MAPGALPVSAWCHFYPPIGVWIPNSLGSGCLGPPSNVLERGVISCWPVLCRWAVPAPSGTFPSNFSVGA